MSGANICQFNNSCFFVLLCSFPLLSHDFIIVWKQWKWRMQSIGRSMDGDLEWIICYRNLLSVFLFVLFPVLFDFEFAYGSISDKRVKRSKEWQRVNTLHCSASLPPPASILQANHNQRLDCLQRHMHPQPSWPSTSPQPGHASVIAFPCPWSYLSQLGCWNSYMEGFSLHSKLRKKWIF